MASIKTDKSPRSGRSDRLLFESAECVCSPSTRWAIRRRFARHLFSSSRFQHFFYRFVSAVFLWARRPPVFLGSTVPEHYLACWNHSSSKTASCLYHFFPYSLFPSDLFVNSHALLILKCQILSKLLQVLIWNSGFCQHSAVIFHFQSFKEFQGWRRVVANASVRSRCTQLGDLMSFSGIWCLNLRLVQRWGFCVNERTVYTIVITTRNVCFVVIVALASIWLCKIVDLSLVTL